MEGQNKRIFKSVLIIFASIIILADACLILMHDKKFSENENRTLSQFPEATASSLISGKFMSDAENFVADQFFLRDSWISLKFLADKYTGRENSNGVWLGFGNYLFENPTNPNMDTLKKNVNAIKSFAASRKANIYMTLVPNAITILDQLHPSYTPLYDQNFSIAYVKDHLVENITFVDITDILKAHKYENIYYKSDHHWTSLGAKYAFEVLSDVMHITPVKEYDLLEATDSFKGTMASTSGNFFVKDKIFLYIPKTSDFAYVVENTDMQQKSATMYSSAALQTKSKYDVFFGGNFPLINIKTTNNNSRNLVIFKDSFANAFVQFLIPYFETITLVDARYYSDDIEKLLTNASATDILFLYGANTFVADNYLADVLLDVEK